mmetsp:Transcript_6445/g.17301  ORF Transcript_6445/g.17301 Transcript_6445/m.17301 type:complete len:208 (-) Transcript_6445:1564-2187(-)
MGREGHPGEGEGARRQLDAGHLPGGPAVARFTRPRLRPAPDHPRADDAPPRAGPRRPGERAAPREPTTRQGRRVASNHERMGHLSLFLRERRRKGQSDAGTRRGDTKRRHRQVPARLAPERAGDHARRLPRPTDGHGAVPDQRGSRRRRTRRGDRRRTRLGSVVGHRAGCAVSKVVRAVQRPRAREEGGRGRRRIGRGATVVRAVSS